MYLLGVGDGGVYLLLAETKQGPRKLSCLVHGRIIRQTQNEDLVLGLRRCSVDDGRGGLGWWVLGW